MTEPGSLDELSGYPCGFRDEWHGQQQCSEECPAVMPPGRPCPLLAIYRRHMALRKAVLGDMGAELAARIYRGAATHYNGRDLPATEAHFDALADAAGDAEDDEAVLRYVAHLERLRQAVLGDMTPEEAAEIYSVAAFHCEGASLYNASKRLDALTTFVEGL